MGILFLTPFGLNEGSIIHLKVLVPGDSQPVAVKGILKWIQNKREFFIGGIEWFRINDRTKRINN